MSILSRLKTAMTNAGKPSGFSGPAFVEVHSAVEKLSKEGWLQVVYQEDKGSQATVLVLGLSRVESRMELRLMDFLKAYNNQVPIGILASEGELKTTNPDMFRMFPDKERNESFMKELLKQPHQERIQLGATAFIGFFIASESSAPFLPLFDMGELTPQIAMAAAKGDPSAQRIFLDTTKEISKRSATKLWQEMQNRQSAFALLQCQSIVLEYASGCCARTAWADKPVNTIGCFLR